jgi:hypothetical protein
MSESTIFARLAVVAGLLRPARRSAIWGARKRDQQPDPDGRWRFGLRRNRILLVVDAMFELPQIAQVVRAVLATCFGIICLTTMPELRHKHRPRHGDSVIQTDLPEVRDSRLTSSRYLYEASLRAPPHRRPVRPGSALIVLRRGLHYPRHFSTTFATRTRGCWKRAVLLRPIPG